MAAGGAVPMPQQRNPVTQTSTLGLEDRRHNLSKDFEVPLIGGHNPLTELFKQLKMEMGYWHGRLVCLEALRISYHTPPRIHSVSNETVDIASLSGLFPANKNSLIQMLETTDDSAFEQGRKKIKAGLFEPDFRVKK